MTDALMDWFGSPAGRYEARIGIVDILPYDKKYGWQLRTEATVERNHKTLTVLRSLAKEGIDPYAVDPSRRKTLAEFAERLGVQSTGPAEEIVAALKSLSGSIVMAHVRPGHTALSVKLYAIGGEPRAEEKAIAGEVLDVVPTVEPDYSPRTKDAQGAHELLITGLHHANRGMALAAEACWRLMQDQGWLALGYSSFNEYLASPEIAMKRSQFYAFADTWEQYIVTGGQDENRLCHPSKLEVPLKALKAGDVSPEEALADVEVMGLRDLRIKYRGEPDESERPDKPDTATYPFACAACGSVIENENGIKGMAA